MPLGAELTAASIWKSANDKIPASVAARLDAAKPYLFGSVKMDKFDPVKFDEAAKLVEELLQPPVPAEKH